MLPDYFQNRDDRAPITVCRLFLHLSGQEVAPLLGVLNAEVREAFDADGSLDVIAEGLAKICHSVLQMDSYWYAAANESSVFEDEDAAADYVDDLFADSTQRYLSEILLANPESDSSAQDWTTISIPKDLLIMFTLAFEGRVKLLESSLAEFSTLKAALETLIRLYYQGRFCAVQVHFLPTQLGEQLTLEQIRHNFPELLPLKHQTRS